jgi:hypothetical protein
LGLPEISGESEYFSTSLDLRDKFDFGPILEGNGIVPDDENLYDLDEISSAIKKVLGVDPGLTCYVLRGEKKQYLSQMQICLSKDYEQMNCVGRSIELLKIETEDAQQTDCQQGIPVHYPTIQYSPPTFEMLTLFQKMVKFVTDRMWHFVILFVLVILVLKVFCYSVTVQEVNVVDEKTKIIGI